MTNNVKSQCEQPVNQPQLKSIFNAVIVLFFDVIQEQGNTLLKTLGPEFFLFVLGGFIAQMIDGSLGMAYGVSASTFLMSFWLPLADLWIQ